MAAIFAERHLTPRNNMCAFAAVRLARTTLMFVHIVRSPVNSVDGRGILVACINVVHATGMAILVRSVQLCRCVDCVSCVVTQLQTIIASSAIKMEYMLLHCVRNEFVVVCADGHI